MTSILSGYLAGIVQASGCAPSEAKAVEELMRLSTPDGCLDHLDPSSFQVEAQVSFLALRQLLAEHDRYWTRKARG